MNNNFSKELRDLSQKILICADAFDSAMKEIEGRTADLEIRQKVSEDKLAKQDKVLKGLRDLLAEYD